MAATAHISFLCDLRKGASVREQNSKQPDWRDKDRTAPAVANSKPMALMGCIPPPMWGVVLAPDRMSAENKWNGQWVSLQGLLRPAPAGDDARLLVKREFAGFREDMGFRSSLTWNATS